MTAAVPLAIYDFDGTMIRGDSIVSYLRFAHAKGLLSLTGLTGAALAGLASRVGLISAGEAKRRSLCFRKRLSAEERTELDREFARRLYGRIRPAALEQMARDRAEGRRIVLLSASTDHYMAPLAAMLAADALICTRESDLPGGNCRGQEKARRLREWLNENGIEADFAASAAYGDSAGDAPVLRLVGHPTLVNPGRKAVKSIRCPTVRWEEKEQI